MSRVSISMKKLFVGAASISFAPSSSSSMQAAPLLQFIEPAFYTLLQFKADSCNNFRDLDQSEFAETLAKIGVIPRFAFPNRHDAPAQPFQLGFNPCIARDIGRSEEHTSELQSLMRISYA